MTARVLDVERHLDRNAGLQQDGLRCRALWATVVLNAMNDASRDIRKFLEARHEEGAAKEMKIFAAWLRSRDGREVLGSAGIEPTERAIKRITDAVWSGKAISTIEQGRLNARERLN